MMWSPDWHNVPMSERQPRVTRNDCGEIVVITTHHADGSETVGIVERKTDHALKARLGF